MIENKSNALSNKLSNTYNEVTRDIEVRVLPEYVADESVPEAQVYFYKYTVTVINNSKFTIQLMDRHWIITDGNGHVQHVEGPGVVGAQPFIKPGESHTYNSGCPLPTRTGNMRGTYGVKSPTEDFRIKIPLFFLRHPDTFH